MEDASSAGAASTPAMGAASHRSAPAAPGGENLRVPARRASLSAAHLARPPRADRPGTRWWWQSPTPVPELIEELHAIAEAGFGEVEIAFSPSFWADEAQREALAAVLDEAARLDVGVAMTLGAAWPLQTPNTAPGTHYAARELQYGAAWVSADGGPLAIPVPAPFDDPQWARGGELVAVVAARVLQRGTDPRVVDSGNPWGKPTKIIEPERSTLLDASSLTVLTDAVGPAGAEAGRGGADGTQVVTWQPQPGSWVLTAFWARDTEQGVTSFVDAQAARAALSYLDAYQIGAAAEVLHAPGTTATELFEDSLELNADCLFWSPTMLQRFRQHLGYDLTPYLPLLMVHGQCRYWVPEEPVRADFESAVLTADGQVELTDLGRRVRADFDRLITDLYTTDHLALIQDWAVGHGMRHKAQAAYGQNLEPVRSFRELVRCGGRAEVESLNSGDRAPVRCDHPNWRFSVDWQRSAVGGAHQGGAVRVSTELGAQMDMCYDFSLADYRHMLDKEWALGVTKPFIHGFAAQAPDAPWPTQGRFGTVVSESWNHRHFPQRGAWPALTDYWARGTALLETGTPRTDVAVYRDGFLTTAARGNAEADATAPERLIDAEALERAGFGVQIIDPVGLAEEGAVGYLGEGAEVVLFPDGPAYRALVVGAPTVTADAAAALARYAALGLAIVVVGDLPAGDTGWGGVDRSGQVRADMAAVLTGPRARQVGAWDDVPGALAELGVRPRAGWLPRGGGPAPALLSQVRDATEGRYVLVYNPSATRGVEVDVTIEAPGRVELVDLDAGRTRALDDAVVTRQEGRVGVPTRLEPLGLAVLLVRGAGPCGSTTPEPGQGGGAPAARQASAGESGRGERTVRAAGVVVGELREPSEVASEVTLAWQGVQVLTEEPGLPRLIDLPVLGPGDWREVAELEHVSGTGTYRALVCRQDGTPPSREDVAGLSLRVGQPGGELGGVYRVRVAGGAWRTILRAGGEAPVGEDLAAALAAGDEVAIEIEVRTTLRNATLAADVYMKGPWAVTYPSRPHGLIGPVVLVR